MITDELIEAGLHSAADEFDIPEGALDSIRAQLTPRSAGGSGLTAWRRLRVWRPRLPRSPLAWTAIAVLILVAAVGIPVALGGGNGGGASAGSVSLSPYPGISRQQADSDKLETLSPAHARAGAAVNGPEQGTGAAAGTGGSAPGVGAVPEAAPSAVSAGRSPALGKEHSAAKAPRGIIGHVSSGGVSTAPADVVKTGHLELQAAKGDVGSTIQQLSNLAQEDGGYVESSSSQTSGSRPSGQLTLRVPVAKFQTAVNAASHLTDTKVTSLETNGQDVTGKVVDLTAQINALGQTRRTYLTILSHATTIGETLSVQQRVDSTESQIERLQGQRKLLDHEAAMSTLTVSVDQPGPTQQIMAKPKPRTGLSAAWHKSVTRFDHGVEDIIAILGPILLIVILLGLAGLVWLLGARRLRRRLV